MPAPSTIALLLLAAAPPAGERAAIEAVVRAVIGAVRDGHTEQACHQLAFAPIAEALLGPSWAEASPAAKAELTAGLERLVCASRLVKARQTLARVERIELPRTEVVDDRAACRALLVERRAGRTTELTIDWQLWRAPQGWRVIDAELLGDSLVAALREDHVAPLLARGGVDAVRAALRDELAKLTPAAAR